MEESRHGSNENRKNANKKKIFKIPIIIRIRMHTSYPGSAGVNHAITLIGWDDNRYSRENFNSASNVTSNGAWIARNSWGDDWGEAGYFYISYENKCNYNIVAAEATTSPKYRNNYFYDGSSALSKLKLYPSGSSGISSIANVFQAKAGNGNGEAPRRSGPGYLH